MRFILPSGFIPAPILYKSTPTGPVSCVSPKEKGNFGNLLRRLALGKLDPSWEGSQKLPFDFYCPSVQEELTDSICGFCGEYFVSKAAVAQHKKALHVTSSQDLDQLINEVVERYADSPEPDEEGIPIIGNLSEWMSSEFVEENE